MLSLLDNISLKYILYLFYGAAFLFLGVSIAAKDLKGSDLKFARSLWLLGAFGFLHGAREWLELGHLIEGADLSFQQLVVEKAATMSLTLFSFVFLLQFGTSLTLKLDKKRTRWLRFLFGPLAILWTLYVWRFGFPPQDKPFDIFLLFQHAEIGSRYMFGITGALMTAYALMAYSYEVRNLSYSASKKLYYAGSTFVFYAIFAGIPSTSYFITYMPFPIELLRASAALCITYFISNALNIFDIESRIKIEQQSRLLVQAEKLTSLGQLAAGIAHEINNPLTNASLGIQTLKRKLTGEHIDCQVLIKKLEAVERNIDRASIIAQELLQFSRQQECEVGPVDINSVIQSTLTLLQYKLKPVTVVQSLNSVPIVMGDHGKLEQVFINLLSNSIEACTAGGTISISTVAEGDLVVARVSDTGMGIEPENQSRLFEPFFTTKEIGSGTGLGLSICYGIIRQHHGTIKIASQPGNGTEVTIELPLKEHYENLDR
ncbi:MAG: hypothetical protein A2076_16670 [Geobacteraceae bacterium GWC2_53_11]|nr:MAG: hypothetical protein A2076_16670 [Geobacteraceae bacterium GWC2_53_11]